MDLIEKLSELLTNQPQKIEESVKLIQENKEIITMKTADGWTALQLATYYNAPETINEIINQGTFETINNLSRIHPISIAIENKNTNIIQVFLSHPQQEKIDWNFKEKSGESLVYQAIVNGTQEIAEELIQKNPSLFEKTLHNNTAFGAIIEKNYNNILNNLEYHNDLNDNYEETYIKKAINNDNLDFFSLLQPYTNLTNDQLLNFSINTKSKQIINKIIQSGEIILGEKQLTDIIDIICEPSEKKEEQVAANEIINFLFEIKLPFSKFINKDGKSAILLCIENNNEFMLETLVKNRDSVNFLDYQKNSPLFYAIEKNNLNFVNLLLKNKADANQEDIYGNTPLINAVKRGNRDIVKSILTHCHNVNHTNKAGEHALGIAIKNRNMEITSDLIWGGAEIGKNPYIAIKEETLTSINLEGRADHFSYTTEERIEDFVALVKLGFNLNQKNKNGDTFMLHFIKNGFQWNFNALLKCLSDPNQIDKNGNSLIMCAAEKENQFYFNMLLSRYSKIDLSIKNNKNEDIYDLCIKQRSQEKIEKLLNYNPTLSKEIIEKIFVANLDEKKNQDKKTSLITKI